LACGVVQLEAQSGVFQRGQFQRGMWDNKGDAPSSAKAAC
jgi:hypothetical protein